MYLAGKRLKDSRVGEFPRCVDSHKRPLRVVQRALCPPELSHHAIGRRSVASQANRAGHSVKVIQAQLGQRSRQSTDLYIASWSNTGPAPLGTRVGPLRAGSRQRHVNEQEWRLVVTETRSAATAMQIAALLRSCGGRI